MDKAKENQKNVKLVAGKIISNQNIKEYSLVLIFLISHLLSNINKSLMNIHILKI